MATVKTLNSPEHRGYCIPLSVIPVDYQVDELPPTYRYLLVTASYIRTHRK